MGSREGRVSNTFQSFRPGNSEIEKLEEGSKRKARSKRLHQKVLNKGQEKRVARQ